MQSKRSTKGEAGRERERKGTGMRKQKRTNLNALPHLIKSVSWSWDSTSLDKQLFQETVIKVGVWRLAQQSTWLLYGASNQAFGGGRISMETEPISNG